MSCMTNRTGRSIHTNDFTTSLMKFTHELIMMIYLTFSMTLKVILALTLGNAASQRLRFLPASNKCCLKNFMKKVGPLANTNDL